LAQYLQSNQLVLADLEFPGFLANQCLLLNQLDLGDPSNLYLQLALESPGFLGYPVVLRLHQLQSGQYHLLLRLAQLHQLDLVVRYLRSNLVFLEHLEVLVNPPNQ
jgi:hypothetical protein